MSRFQTILAGAQINDVENTASHDVDAGTFNYYGYARPDGSWVIMREKTDGTEFRYAVGSTNAGLSYATGWSTNNALTYVRSNIFKIWGS